MKSLAVAEGPFFKFIKNDWMKDKKAKQLHVNHRDLRTVRVNHSMGLYSGQKIMTQIEQ